MESNYLIKEQLDPDSTRSTEPDACLEYSQYAERQPGVQEITVAEQEEIKFEGIPRIPLERKMVDGNRFYILDGIDMISVTSILKKLTQPGIDKWRNRIGNDQANIISSNAAEKGTIIHEICEMYLRHAQPTHDGATIHTEQQLNKFPLTSYIQTQFLDKCIEHQLCEYFNEAFLPMIKRISNVNYQEVQLYSRKYKYAGTVDCIAQFDNTLSIIDFKTSKNQKLKKYIDSYFLQTAAYSIAYHELTGINIEQLVILIGVATSPYSYQIFTENINNIYYKTGKSWKDSFIDLVSDK